jgi:two-component sensor histidine kinase
MQCEDIVMPKAYRESRPSIASADERTTRTARLRSVIEDNRSNSLAHAIAATVREPLVVLDRSLGVMAASRSFYKMFQLEAPDAQHHPFHELSAGRWDIPVLRQMLQDVVAGDMAVEAYEVELDMPNIGRRRMLLSARLVSDEQNPDTALLVRLEDVSARREAEGLKDALLQQQKMVFFEQMLLREVQHRVANSLQIIASILLLKARTVQSEETRVHLRDVRQRVISVATVQRQLSMSGVVDEVKFGPYLSALCEALASSMIGDDRAVTIAASSSEGTVKSEDAVSFGLIVTELVINALKHGFPNRRAGHIAVDFAADGLEWRLSVSDNGVGRQHNPAEPDQIGLGTSIVEALAHQLKARVEIHPCNPGTATSIVHAA